MSFYNISEKVTNSRCMNYKADKLQREGFSLKTNISCPIYNSCLKVQVTIAIVTTIYTVTAYHRTFYNVDIASK